MDDLIHLAEVEKERAEESAMVIQLEFDRSLQRLQDSLQYMADATDVDQLVEGKHMTVSFAYLLRLMGSGHEPR